MYANPQITGKKTMVAKDFVDQWYNDFYLYQFFKIIDLICVLSYHLILDKVVHVYYPEIVVC